jgi:ubiquinone/menaquinone biosynthesis C-methylase UbiE
VVDISSYQQPDSYPLRNSAPDEAARLARLQRLHDEGTIRRLSSLGVGEGWHCLELGAGAGSIARWLSANVGPRGSVTAVDRDTSQFEDLTSADNVLVRRGDMVAMSFPGDAYHLVHSRSVLMHVPEADAVVARVVGALRTGGVVLLEEVDGGPAATAVDPPEAFVRVMMPLAARWRWARGLPETLWHLGLRDVRDSVRLTPLVGATEGATFWQHTLRSIRGFLTDPGVRGIEAPRVSGNDVDAMIALLDDPAFEAPFTARHAVSGRRPSPDAARTA